MAKRPAPEGANSAKDPDQLEQRQRADGAVEESEAIEELAEELAPDAVEQHQRRDGTVERLGAVDAASSAPPTPDVLEQHQVIEYDEEDERPEE